MKNTRYYVTFGVIAFMVFIFLSGAVVGDFNKGEFWSILDNSLVQTDPDLNVVIGANSSEYDGYKLYVNGSTYINNTLFIYKEGIDQLIYGYDDTHYLQSYVDPSGDAYYFIPSGNYYYFDNPIRLPSLNTGHGENELYEMNQNVLTNSDVGFNNLTVDGTTELNDDVTINGETRHTEDITLAGDTKSDAKDFFIRSHYKQGFTTFLPSTIQFFDEADNRGSIWYKDYSSIGVDGLQGLHLKSNNGIILDANSGAGTITLNGLTVWGDDIKIGLGNPPTGSDRFQLFANENGGFLNPSCWDIGCGLYPEHFTFNDNLRNTDFIVNSSQGESLVVDGATGIVNATHGYSTNVGDGLTFTFNCTEGEVFVTNGIITGKDW